MRKRMRMKIWKLKLNKKREKINLKLWIESWTLMFKIKICQNNFLRIKFKNKFLKLHVYVSVFMLWVLYDSFFLVF